MKTLFKAFQGLPTLSALVALLWLATLAAQAEDYTYITNNDTICITKYIGPGGDVSIPETITGLPVTTIASYAFAGCTNLTSITISQNVTNYFGDAFFYCTGLAAIYAHPLNPVFTSVAGVMFNKTKTVLVQYPMGRAGNYAIPDTVTAIGYTAFYSCSGLTDVTLPHGLTSIEDGAFEACPALTNLAVPGTVTNIGWNAFAGCTNLATITLPENMLALGGWAFYNCRRLTSVTIPEGVPAIEERTFYSCSSLTNVVIPQSAALIGEWAFYQCFALSSVTIPDPVTVIGRDAFCFCTNLETIIVGHGLQDLGEFAFAWCPRLTKIYFGGNRPGYNNPFLDDRDHPETRIYILPGTTWSGWSIWWGRPFAYWYLPNPEILDFAPTFDVHTNRFGFTISWATNASVVVEASTNLADSSWLPVSTNNLAYVWYFTDPDWTNYPARFYRVRSP